MTEIIELNSNTPNVESVCNKLQRHHEKIKHITAIVSYKDGSYDVFADQKDTMHYSHDASILNKLIMEFFDE